MKAANARGRATPTAATGSAAVQRLPPQGGRGVPHHRRRGARAGEADGCLRPAEEVTQRLLDALADLLAMIVGQDAPSSSSRSAWASRKLHHAWLLAGPKGVGKATFAHAAARRVLAEAAGPPVGSAGARNA